MKLATLLQCLSIAIPQDQNIDIKSIQSDSRKIQPGDLFIAIAGLTTDGQQYIQQAIGNGAVAVLVERALSGEQHGDVIVIEIKDLDKKSGLIAAAFYSNSSDAMDIVGVTGTNGKSSTCHYIAEILRCLADKAAVIGTLGVGTIEGYTPGTHTTPDPIELQKNLAELQVDGTKTVAMEVSSHALIQGRVNGIKFDTAVFTNLTQDHLDYHATMANYWQAKIKLFVDFAPNNTVINLDDPYGWQLLALLPSGMNVICYSLENRRKTPGKLLVASNIQYTMRGISATVIGDFGTKTVELPIIGDFNLSNMLAAIAACITLGHAFADVLSVVHKVKNIPGRMQCIQEALQPLVVVDYAHTPDALARVLATLKQHCQGKLWCVFGCGGDRDRTKRTEMLAAALRFSDHIILTQDNPRTENPNQIIEDTLKNHKNLHNIVVEQDRRAAIQLALSKARSKDIVLIAGKGHENQQIIGTNYLPFSDVEVVKGILNSKG